MEENFEIQTPAPSSFDNLENQSPYNNPQTSFNPPARRRSPKKFLYILGAVLLILIVLSLVRAIGSKGKKASNPSPTPSISLETPSPSPIPSGTPTATPAPAKNPVSSIDVTTGLDRAKLSVSVQNGSGTAGVAGKVADILKSLGYNVTSTGNADNFNYANVTIKTKPASKDYLPVLNKDLSSNNYSIGSTSSDLSATASADTLVIVGK